MWMWRSCEVWATSFIRDSSGLYSTARIQMHRWNSKAHSLRAPRVRVWTHVQLVELKEFGEFMHMSHSSININVSHHYHHNHHLTDYSCYTTMTTTTTTNTNTTTTQNNGNNDRQQPLQQPQQRQQFKRRQQQQCRLVLMFTNSWKLSSSMQALQPVICNKQIK